MTNKAGQKVIGFYTEDGMVFLENNYREHFGGAQGAAVDHCRVVELNTGKFLTVYQICEQDTVS